MRSRMRKGLWGGKMDRKSGRKKGEEEGRMGREKELPCMGRCKGGTRTLGFVAS